MKKIKIFLPIFLALVMCLTSIRPVLAVESTNDTNVVSSDSQQIATFETKDGFVEFEAEHTTLNTSLVSLLDANADPAKVASGGAAVQMTSNGGNKSGDTLDVSATPGIQFEITPDVVGTYYIWIRCVFRSKSQDNVWLSLSDSGAYNSVTIPSSDGVISASSTDYVWRRLKTNGTKKVTTVGESYTVRFSPRDVSPVDGFNTIFDKFIITTDENYEPSVAQIGDNNYATLQGAIGAAAAEDTITLRESIVYKEDLEIGDGITLDLNGNTLDMGDNSLYSYYGNVVDDTTGKTGRLVVDTYDEGESATMPAGKPKGNLAPGNSQVPIYIADEDAYMFATMKRQSSVSISEDKDNFTVISRPSFGGADYAAKLAGGADDAKLQFIIRLDWDENGASYYQPLQYADDLVKTVYKEDKAFSVKVNGLSAYKDSMKVTVLVKSDLGVEWVNNSFYMSPAN